MQLLLVKDLRQLVNAYVASFSDPLRHMVGLMRVDTAGSHKYHVLMDEATGMQHCKRLGCKWPQRQGLP